MEGAIENISIEEMIKILSRNLFAEEGTLDSGDYSQEEFIRRLLMCVVDIKNIRDTVHSGMMFDNNMLLLVDGVLKKYED